MSELTRADVIEAVKEALGNHPCRYQLSPQQLDHVVGMLSDIGDGDLRRGVEIVRENHKWIIDRLVNDEEYTANHELISSIRKGMSGIGWHLAKAIAWAVIIVIAALLWIGFKVKIFQ